MFSFFYTWLHLYMLTLLATHVPCGYLQLYDGYMLMATIGALSGLYFLISQSLSFFTLLTTRNTLLMVVVET